MMPLPLLQCQLVEPVAVATTSTLTEVSGDACAEPSPNNSSVRASGIAMAQRRIRVRKAPPPKTGSRLTGRLPKRHAVQGY